MAGRERRWVFWLVGLVLLVVIALVALVLLSSNGNIGMSAQAASATSNAIAVKAITQTALAVQTADSRATQQAVLEELTQTALAQAPTDLPTDTGTPRPTPTPTEAGIAQNSVSGTATALASILQTMVTNPTVTRRATEGVPVDVTARPTLSNVQKTATALAILFQSTAITPTSATIGGGITDTPTPEDAGDFPTDTPTPQPTQTRAPQETPIPIEIAAANLLIRSDVSGEVIGDGTLRVYAPESASYPETARVELELHLDNLYITPTPTGERGTPVVRSTTVASSGGTTPTPYLPIITDQGIPVYQRMGATLLCSGDSFRGCDSGRDQSQTKIVSSQITSWSWIISPNQNITGSQDLQLEVWLVERNLDGNLETIDLTGTPYHFTIEVNPPGDSGPLPILIVGVAVLMVVGAGVLIVRGRNKPASVQTQPRAGQPAPLVFISYRRGSSWGQARSIEQSLRERGADVFIDIDDINEGRFAETIEKAILGCDYFVAVLAPGTLESTWVCREIAYALTCKKVIIPLLIDGFKLDEKNIPPEIKDIASHNAITVLPEFYQEAIDRLAQRFLRLGDKGK